MRWGGRELCLVLEEECVCANKCFDPPFLKFCGFIWPWLAVVCLHFLVLCVCILFRRYRRLVGSE